MGVRPLGKSGVPSHEQEGGLTTTSASDAELRLELFPSRRVDVSGRPGQEVQTLHQSGVRVWTEWVLLERRVQEPRMGGPRYVRADNDRDALQRQRTYRSRRQERHVHDYRHQQE